MALTNFTDLTAAVADFLNRSDLSAVIPDFVVLAEADMNRTLRVREMSVRTRAPVDAQYLKMPSDFLALRNIDLLTDPVTPLEYRNLGNLDSHRRADKSGQPVFYSIMQNNLEFAPVPDGEYEIEIVYYQRIPALEANATNWMMDKHPDAYLFGTLMQSAPYLGADERITVWATRYSQIIEQIIASDDNAKYGGSTLSVTFNSFG